MDIKALIIRLGGPTKIAQHLKSAHPRGHISKSAVAQWKRVPAEHCVELSRLSGGEVTPQQMRPDVFTAGVDLVVADQQQAA